jgi:predicted transcriptional regulator
MATSKPLATDVARMMKAAHRLAGFGDIRLTLHNAGGFVALALPDRTTAQRRAQAKLEAMGHSVTLEQVTEAMEDAGRQPLANGRGTTPEEALERLMAELRVLQHGTTA